MNVLTFCAPAAGSCLPWTDSSRTMVVSLNLPPSKPAALACSTAKIAPFAVGTPTAASAPFSGRSTPISIVGTPPDVLLPDDEPEQAAREAVKPATTAARRIGDQRMCDS